MKNQPPAQIIGLIACVIISLGTFVVRGPALANIPLPRPEMAELPPSKEMEVADAPQADPVPSETHLYLNALPDCDAANVKRALGQAEGIVKIDGSWSFNRWSTEDREYQDCGGIVGRGLCDLATVFNVAARKTGLRTDYKPHNGYRTPGFSAEETVLIWWGHDDLVIEGQGILYWQLRGGQELAVWIEQAGPGVAPEPEKGGLSAVWPQQITQHAGDIEWAAGEFQFDADLLAALVLKESCGCSWCTSADGFGSVGLMQPLPDKFQIGEDPGNPRDNLSAGCRYLAKARAISNEPREWARGYNGGLGVIGHWAYPSTEQYADQVMAFYNAAKRGDGGPMSQFVATNWKLCGEALQQ